MKILLFLLIFSFVAFGQTATRKTKVLPKPSPKALTCDDYTFVHTDKIKGGSNHVGRKRVAVSEDSKSGFIFFLLAAERDLSLNVKVVEGSRNACLDSKAEIAILFADGSRLSLRSSDDFNCSGDATVYFGGVFGKYDELEELATKKIKAMRIYTYKSNVQSDFTDAQASEILNQISCLRKSLPITR
jgi:hypothetical protein